MILSTYVFNFDNQLGSSNEQVLATILSGEDFDGDGFKDIKITLTLADASNSGTEDLIGVAFDIGNDSLINSLGLTINNIETFTSNGTLSSYTPTYVIGADRVADNKGFLNPDFNTTSSSGDEPYDVGIKFSDQGSGEGIVQSASFVISANQDLTSEYFKAILDNTDWYIRLQSTDGGENSAKTGGLILIPEITIDKVTNGSDGLTILAGTDITWSYTVNNTGSAGLSNIIVTDDQGEIPMYVSGDSDSDGILDADETLTGIDSDGDGKLDVKETWIYKATGTAIAGDYTNLGTAIGTYKLNNVSDSDPSNYFGANPSIAIDKVTNGADGLEILAGTQVTWTYTVTNTGNVDLSNLNLTDDQGVLVTLISGDDNGDGILQTSETWLYQGTGTAIAGAYSNIGTVIGEYTDDLGNTANPTDSDASNYFGANPSVAIDKVTNGADGLEILAGTEVTWTYTVTNTGNVDLSNLNLTDDQGVLVTLISGDDNGDGILQTSETWLYQGKGTAIVGAYSNIGTVVGEYTDDLGNTANPTDSDASNYFGIEPPTAISPVIEEGIANTPGFWKQQQHFQYWPSSYSPNKSFTGTFGVSASLKNNSLLGALSANGGGINALARSATAGLLNAASDESGSAINYILDQSALAISVVQVGASFEDIMEILNIIDLNSDQVIGSTEVISAVQDTLTNGGYFNGDADIISVAKAFDAMNNMPSLDVSLF